MTLQELDDFFPMDFATYRAAMNVLGLKINEAGRFFGVDNRAARRWATGKMDVPDHVAMLIALMLLGEITPEQARHYAKLGDLTIKGLSPESDMQ
jgi:hypothetical protein